MQLISRSEVIGVRLKRRPSKRWRDSSGSTHEGEMRG